VASAVIEMAQHLLLERISMASASRDLKIHAG
jgi:hypothetical protein